jgi:hypothetical protein
MVDIHGIMHVVFHLDQQFPRHPNSSGGGPEDVSPILHRARVGREHTNP